MTRSFWALLLLASCGEEPMAVSPIKISWLGDSNTQGFHTTGVNGPRKEFYEYCVEHGRPIELVGEKSNGQFPMPDHGGFSGFTIGNLTGKINATYGPGEEFSGVQLGFLLIGTNNMGLGATPFEDPGTMDLMATILTAWASASEVSTLIVFSLPPIDPAEGAPAANVDTFNAALPGLVSAAAVAHPNTEFVYVDLNAALSPWSLDRFVDRSHMNDAGASIWAQLAIEAALPYLPESVMPELPRQMSGSSATVANSTALLMRRWP